MRNKCRRQRQRPSDGVEITGCSAKSYFRFYTALIGERSTIVGNRLIARFTESPVCAVFNAAQVGSNGGRLGSVRDL